MNRIIQYIALMLVCLGLGVSTIQAAADQSLEEQNLTRVGQEALNNIFGPGNFVVRVRVQMSGAQYSVKYTRQSRPAGVSKEAQRNEKTYILPGVPAIKNISPDKFNQLPFDSVTNMAPSRVARMGIFLIANKEVPRRQVSAAEAILKQVLDFQDGRDAFKVKTETFYLAAKGESAPQKITVVPGEEKLVTPQNIFYAVISALFLIFMIMFGLSFKSKMGRESSSGSGAGSITVSAPSGGGGGGGNDRRGGNTTIDISEAPKIKRYFDFVTEKNIDNLLYLLKKEQISVEYVTMIVSFLPSELASKVLLELPPKDQVRVAQELMDQRLSNKEILDKLEKKLQSALECFVGGMSKVEAMFEFMPSESKKSVLIALKQAGDPVVFQKFRKITLIFEDLFQIPDRDLQTILYEIKQPRQLVMALQGISQRFYQRVLDNISERVRLILDEEQNRLGAGVFEKDILEVREEILSMVRDMERNGAIEPIAARFADINAKIGDEA